MSTAVNPTASRKFKSGDTQLMRPSSLALHVLLSRVCTIWDLAIGGVNAGKGARAGGQAVQATAGTDVVILGWDIEDLLKADLLGFAIQRVDHTENENVRRRGMKTFPNNNPPLPLGGNASSREQPFQTFQWGDYSAKPDHQYTYTITAMSGQPGALVAGASLSVDIATEAEDGGIHSIYFNRGAIASQEYARRFQNKSPNEVGEAAYTWAIARPPRSYQKVHWESVGPKL